MPKETKVLKVLNVYSKLAKARLLLQGKPLKKSGFNGYAKYNYYQLDDFIPFINEINDELGLFTQIQFESESHVVLRVINTERPEEVISFYSKNVEAGIKGAQAIQNLGGEQTYQRRYLYLQAYEITENDVIDAVDPKLKKDEVYKLSDADLKSLEQHLSSLTTKNQIDNAHTQTAQRARGAKLDKKIEDIFAFYTDEMINYLNPEGDINE